MDSATEQRDAAIVLAQSDPSRSLERARRIADPWFRCQALSAVALHAKGEDIQAKTLLEAFAAAGELIEPNRLVTVSAWPLKALSLLGRPADVAANTRRLLSIIGQEDSPVRRADALRELFGAVISEDDSVVISVLHALVDSCLAPLNGARRNRKGEYLLEACIPAIARIDPQSALRTLAQLPPSRAERARKRIVETQDIPLVNLVTWPHIR